MTSQAGAPTLLGMPDEILLKILKEFDGVREAEGTESADVLSTVIEPRIVLFHLTLCCKRLNKIVTPILYTTLVQSQDYTLYSFLNRLLDAPDLAKHVKRVYCQAREPRPIIVEFDERPQTPPRRRLPLLPDRILARCTNLISNTFSGDIVTEWLKSVEKGHWGARFAVLLCLVPSIEAVELFGYDGGCETTFVEKVLNNAALLQIVGASGGHSLSSLKFASLRDLRGYYKTGPTHVHPFLSVPSVASFSVETFDAGDFISWGDNDTYATTNLLLKHSYIGHGKLVEGLQRFRSLESLYFDHSSRWMFPHTWKDAIVHLQGTLQSLRITGNVLRGINPFAQDIGSLKNFKVLRSVTMECITLLGHKSIGWLPPQEQQPNLPEPKRLIEVLPASLEELKLINCERIISQIVEVLEQKDAYFPSLKVVEVDYGLIGDEGFDLALLVDDARSKGVELTIRSARDWWTVLNMGSLLQ